MSHLTPNTPAAAAKLLRALTSTLPTASPAPTPSETFTTATAETCEPLLTALISVLTSTTPPQTQKNALQTLFNISNTLPPRHLAPHWRTLCQRVITISKQSPHPHTLITLASLLIASIPLSTLGTEQRAVVAAIAQQSLQHAQNTLSTYPTHSLCLIYSVIYSAPRELRSQTLDDRLQILFKHPSRDARSLTAKVFAAMVTCAPEKQQQKLFSERVEYICEQITDVTSLLNAFTGCKHNGRMSEKTAREVCDHLDGIFMVLVELLDLPIRVPFPLGKVLKPLQDGLRERVIDPYAAVEGVKITHDDLLFIIPQVQKLCAQVIAAITQRVHKVALQMFIKDIGMVFEMRMSKLLLRSRDGSGITCVVERGEVYETIGRLVTNLGTGLLDFVVPRFQELVEIDVTLYKKCLAGELMLTVDPASNMQSGGKSRKRKRHNGRRDASVGGHVLTKESTRSLASVYGNETGRSVRNTFNIALDVIARMFDCRGLLTKPVVKHLQRLEDMLLEFLDGKSLSPVLLRAVTSAALSGGSRRMAGETSSLLMPLARVSVMAALDTNLSTETREVAMAARTGCEAIIHPRGPPYVQESCMYAKIVGNDRSIVEKRAAKKDSARLSEKRTTEQNGNWRGEGGGYSVALDTKETVSEGQDGVLIEDTGEKNGQTIVDASTEKEPMEVEGIAEMQPLDTKAHDELPDRAKSKGGERDEVLPKKQLGTEHLQVYGENGVDGEADLIAPIPNKTRTLETRVEERQANSTGQPDQLQEVNVNKGDGSQEEPSPNPSDMKCPEVTEPQVSRTQREESNPPIDCQPVNPEDPEVEGEQDSEIEDQALINSLVFEPSDGE